MQKNITLHLKEATEFLREKTDKSPKIGMIIGTGLGRLAEEIDIELEIPYLQIPNFSLSTVESHKGNLIFGKIAGKEIVAMQGRFHYYEGYSMKQITFPVRVMKAMGVETLLISNACGSMNPEFKKSEIMIIDDHINLLGDNPLIGINNPELGPRFPDMSRPYDPELMELTKEIAKENGIKIHSGVYAAMSGPSLETRAEYRFLRTIGADVIGMSTVPENIVAIHCGMRVLGLSVITDECDPDNLKPVKIDEILSAATEAEPNLALLCKKVIDRI